MKGAVVGLGGHAGVDGSFGGDKIVWGEGDGRLRGGEEKSQLVGDEVTS